VVVTDPTTCSLSLDSFDVIAPFCMIVDSDGRLRHIGPGLARACPGLAVGAAWSGMFAAATPGMALTLADLRARVGTTFELRDPLSELCWRGTVLPIEGRTEFVLVGTPQFTDAESLAASGLTDLDFAPGDPTFALFGRLARGRWARPVVPADLIEEIQLGRLTGIPGKTRSSLAADILDVFASRFEGALTALRAAVEASDAERTQQEAHALKGSALTIGAVGVGELCALIEQDAREGRVEHGLERCAAIEARWAESAPFLWTIVDRRGGREG